jgi:hypothetical protein
MSKMNNSKDYRQKGIEYKLKNDGSENPKYVDLLDEDKVIAGQKYCCISFVSPEHIIKQREQFYFEEFVKSWDLSKSLEKFNQFLSFISYKYNINMNDFNNDLQSFVNEERDTLSRNNLLDDYKNYLDNNEDKLEKKFNELYDFQTSVRGIKVRGSFPTQEEAELRCKLLREMDPYHDVYVGPVGVWMPFHPEAYKTGRVEYIEDELNQLMHEKRNNEDKAKEEFDKRVKEAKRKAIEENKQKAMESGNKLTQSLDENDELISVKHTNTIEENILSSSGSSVVTSADIRKELFENENVITTRTHDAGLSRLNLNNESDGYEEEKI